ncbi:MAG: Methyltransferase type 11 [Gammaproteobacteria bacterium]|nr:Methyltransferase type 11 [Gammaproteobacteria bacterium]
MTRNFGAAAQDYAKYRAGFPDSFYDRLKVFGIGTPGQRVVDIGTGTGVLARGFAQRGCQVISVDPDDRLLEQARLLDREASVQIEYRSGVAENLPVEDNYADIITAGTCWHWFDGPVAAREARRIGKPGAFIVFL